jgi:hypothetical protein
MDGDEAMKKELTESRVRTKLSTSMEMVAPSLLFSSLFFARAIFVIGDGVLRFSDGMVSW